MVRRCQRSTRPSPDLGKVKCMEKENFSWALKKEQDLEIWRKEREKKRTILSGCDSEQEHIGMKTRGTFVNQIVQLH